MTAPTYIYIVLKNPSRDGSDPGSAANLIATISYFS